MVLEQGDPLPSTELRPASFGDVDLSSPDLRRDRRGPTSRSSTAPSPPGSGGCTSTTSDRMTPDRARLLYWGIESRAGDRRPYPSKLEGRGSRERHRRERHPRRPHVERPRRHRPPAGGPAGPARDDPVRRGRRRRYGGPSTSRSTTRQPRHDPQRLRASRSCRAATSRSTTASSTTFPEFGDLFNAPSALSVFDGTDPNGTWRLYAVDDAEGSVTSIRGLVPRHRDRRPDRPERHGLGGRGRGVRHQWRGHRSA